MVEKEQNQAATATPERRAEPRIQTNHSVLFRTANGLPIEACVLDVSTIEVRLRASEPVPVGAAVRIDGQEMLLFGTVTRCDLIHGAYDVGILLTRPLELLGELRKLNETFLVESEHSPVETELA